MEEHATYGTERHELPDYTERVQCQLPALHLLMQLGWQYLWQAQRAIAAVFTTANEEVKSHKSKCVALKGQKKGLIQKLLTGKVRMKA